MSAHTPTFALPLTAECVYTSNTEPEGYAGIFDANGREVIQCTMYADAVVIAQQLNSHDQLLAERDALRATTAKLREALTELLDARGTSLNIVGHDPVSGHPLSREGMAALKARAALSSTTP